MTKILKICVFLVFIGRAYQYLFFDAPFRAFLWDESLLQDIIENIFNTPWNEYVTNPTVNIWIQRIIQCNGLLFLFSAISSLAIHHKNIKFLKLPIFISGVLLILLSLLSAKEKFYHYGQFFEHAIQFGIPFVLLFAIKKENTIKKVSFVLKILVATTFTSHGLYALGYYPVPGTFIDMTINSIGVTEDNAVLLLYIVGILDIVLSILIFVPKIAKYALIYACFWGLITASARVIANFNVDFIDSSLHQSLYLVVYRIPHGVIPLLIYYLDYVYKSFKKGSALHPITDPLNNPLLKRSQ
ncbi:hypothetical protein GCM10022393_10370 [Aquimarina addita]|uniref:EpsG family protein n=1 Tax=Aquimarina addita TaxID=870485 RepID=A0ABP7XD25_9FLAO